MPATSTNGCTSKGVITDFRGDRLRIGFGVYQDEEDVDRLLLWD